MRVSEQDLEHRLKGKFAVGLTLLLLFVGMALWPRPGEGSHVDPVYVDHSASCEDLAPAAETWYELQVEPVESGLHARGPLTVNLARNESGDLTTLDWSASTPVDAVFVKGGPGGNFYHYEPAETADSGLRAPLNRQSGKQFNPGYILFCTTTRLDIPTPTATQPPTATPPPPETPTPTASATTATTATSTATATATAVTTVTASPTLDPSITPSPSPTTTGTPGRMTPTPSATPPVRPILHIYFPLTCIDCFASPGEPNDSCGASYPLRPNSAYQFLAEDDHDWYQFVLPDDAHVEVRLENFVPLFGQIAAYRGDNCESAQFIQNNGDAALQKRLDLGAQPPGRFFLYISNDGPHNNSDPYRIFIETR